MSNNEKIIDWKDILSSDFFNGLSDDLKKKRTFDEWLLNGNFSCVNKNKYHLIKEYMEQERLPYPSKSKINYHKRKKVKEVILISVLIIFLIAVPFVLYFGVLQANKNASIEELEHAKRTEVISDYLEAEPSNLLIEDKRSMMTNKYNGISYVTFQGNKFYVEMQKHDNEEWEISKIVQLQ